MAAQRILRDGKRSRNVITAIDLQKIVHFIWWRTCIRFSISITMKELKSFLSRVNCKITTAKLLEHFNEVDVRQRGELRFDDFLRLYQKLLVVNSVSSKQMRG